MTWGSDDNDQARYDYYKRRREFYDKIWTWWNKPRNIMTYATLISIRGWLAWAALVQAISMFVVHISIVDHPVWATIRMSLFFFSFISFIVLGLIKGHVEQRAQANDLARRMDAINEEIGRLVEHAKKTGYYDDK